MILVGLVYFVVNVAFAELAGRAASNTMRVVLNRLGFVVSLVAFAAHIVYDQRRLGNPPRTTATHVALSAGLGAFGLALTANVHGLWVGSNRQYSLALALIVWPVITALPAFEAAVAAAAGLAFIRRGG